MKPYTAVVVAAITLTMIVGTALASGISDPNPHLETAHQVDIPLNYDTQFFGNMVWDPVNHKFRLFVHDGLTNRIYQQTSHDGIRNWSSQSLVLSQGTAGAWDDYEIGVPFGWYESGEVRPWRMLYRGHQSGGYYAIGLATSTDGDVWERKDTTGAVLTSAVLSRTPGSWDDSGFDMGGMIKVDNTYTIQYSSEAHPRRIGVATSTDLTTWVKDANNPTYNTTEGADIVGATYDPALGRFCADITKWTYPNGTIGYFMFVPHYTVNATKRRMDLEVYSSPIPQFYRANRSFVGNMFRSNVTPVPTIQGVNITGIDTPRWVTDDITRDLSKTTVTGDQRWMIMSVEAYRWNQEKWIYSIPNSTFVNVTDTINVGNGAPTISLRPTGDANTVSLWLPGLTGMPIDFTWNNRHLYSNNLNISSSGFNLNGTTSDLHYYNLTYPESLNAITEDFTIEETFTLAGDFDGYKSIFAYSSAPPHHFYIYLGGSSGSYTLGFSATSGGITRDVTTAFGPLVIGTPYQITITKTGGKLYMFKDGNLLNPGGTAFNYVIDTTAATVPFYIGSTSGTSEFFNGTIDEIRVSNVSRGTTNFTPTALSYYYTPEGTIFTDVQDMGTETIGTITLNNQKVPTGTSISIYARNATDNHDKSVTIGDFQSYPGFRPSNQYHQYAIVLSTTDTNTTPSFTGVSMTGGDTPTHEEPFIFNFYCPAGRFCLGPFILWAPAVLIAV
jgi:hypothetical protein